MPETRRRLKQAETSQTLFNQLRVVSLLLLLLLSLSLYIGYSLVCPRDKPCPQGIHHCGYSFVSLSIRCMMHISLVPTLVLMVFYISTFHRMCAVPNMAVFCSSRTSWLPGRLPTYFQNDLEMVPVAPFITALLLLLLLLPLGS